MKQSKPKNGNTEEFTIDAIAMKRRLQAQFYEETKGLSAEELIAYMRRKIAESEFADFLDQPAPTAEETTTAKIQRTTP
jgi:hypothetical protein